MSERKQYPSDLSDEQWSLIKPVITAWKDRHRSVSGHQGAYDMRPRQTFHVAGVDYGWQRGVRRTDNGGMW